MMRIQIDILLMYCCHVAEPNSTRALLWWVGGTPIKLDSVQADNQTRHGSRRGVDRGHTYQTRQRTYRLTTKLDTRAQGAGGKNESFTLLVTLSCPSSKRQQATNGPFITWWFVASLQYKS